MGWGGGEDGGGKGEEIGMVVGRVFLALVRFYAAGLIVPTDAHPFFFQKP